jgi:hypothetical protein
MCQTLLTRCLDKKNVFDQLGHATNTAETHSLNCSFTLQGHNPCLKKITSILFINIFQSSRIKKLKQIVKLVNS